MRVSTACLACRSRRRKCHTPHFGSSCTYCSERGLRCTRDAHAVSRSSSTASKEIEKPLAPFKFKSPTTSAFPLSTQLPPPKLCFELVQLYFDFVHDQFHSLFHRPTFLDDVENRLAPPVILFAMISLSARFSDSPVFANIIPRERGHEFAKESSRLLDLRDVSLTTLQACVLLGAIAITENEAAAESVYYCAACRIANLLDLPNRPVADAIEREVNIRVWWSLCMIDVWSSTGVGLPRMMPSLDSIPLPIEEVLFERLGPGDSLPPEFEQEGSIRSSLQAQMIQLNRILMAINELNERTASGPTISVNLENMVLQLSNRLDAWHAGLPDFMHNTPVNLQRYASLGLGRVFVAVYLGYYHFGQLLFYQFLHGDCHSKVLSAKYYANKCKSHAEHLCELVYASRSIPGCDVRYTMVGHIMVIASTVQIHTLLFSENDLQISAARRRLEQNFEILSQLRTFWPTLDISFTRLRVFHQTCSDSMGESFRLDQWMLRFLCEFAEPVDDKILWQTWSDTPWNRDQIDGGQRPLRLRDARTLSA